MRLVHLACVCAGLALAACESPPVEDAGSAADGQAAADAQAPVVADSGPTVERLGGVTPGSSEDFVVNVGDRVFFELDSHDLTEEARIVIQNQVVWLKDYPDLRITLEGHADERGTREYNLALGERRANSVRDYMIALGVAAGRVTTISYGKERPVDPASTEDAWARNRRAVTAVGGGST